MNYGLGNIFAPQFERKPIVHLEKASKSQIDHSNVHRKPSQKQQQPNKKKVKEEELKVKKSEKPKKKSPQSKKSKLSTYPYMF